MKIDKFIKAVSDRLDSIISNANGDNANGSGDIIRDYYTIIRDDDYYLDQPILLSVPPRFDYYRQIRKKLNRENSVTSDELNYGMKHMLRRMTPQQRYEREKTRWYQHESSWCKRGLDRYDEKGCNQFTGCIPECRYYHEYGRLDNEEVVEMYKRREESCRQNNTLMNIDLPFDLDQFLIGLYNERYNK